METKFKIGDKVRIPKTKSIGHGLTYFLNDSYNFRLKNTTYLYICKITKNSSEIAHWLSINMDYNNHHYNGDLQNNGFAESDLELYEEIKQNNKMAAKTAVITLEVCKEMYNSGITSLKEFALINYTEEELTRKELPKKWEDLEYIKGYHINDGSRIVDYSKCTMRTISNNLNIFPTKSLAEASLALAQLLQLRDKYNEGIDLKLGDANVKKFAIYYCNDNKSFMIDPTYKINKIFTFKDVDTAQQFLDNFKDLLWTAKELV